MILLRQGTGRGSSLDLHVVPLHPEKPCEVGHPGRLQRPRTGIGRGVAAMPGYGPRRKETASPSFPALTFPRPPPSPAYAEQLSAGSGSSRALCVFGCAGEQEAVILPHGSGDRLVGVGSVGSSAPPSRLAPPVSAHAGRVCRGKGRQPPVPGTGSLRHKAPARGGLTGGGRWLP